MAVPLSPKNTGSAFTEGLAPSNPSKPAAKKDGYASLRPAQGPPRSPPAARSTSDSAQAPAPDGQLPPLAPGQTQSQLKKVTRRTSKPIINWFQRKLTTGRARRASEGHGARPKLPDFDGADGDVPPVPGLPASPARRPRKGTASTVTERPKSTVGFETSGPKDDAPPVPSLITKSASADDKPKQTLADEKPKLEFATDKMSPMPKHSPQLSMGGKTEESHQRSSIAPESTWSPSVMVEADEDASMRPLAPSAPPSPSLSNSSSSYLSDPHTFRSGAASTKPTTVLSIDVGNGMAHIAQAPITPLSQQFASRDRTGTHARISSTGASSHVFALPSTPTSATPPTSQDGHGAPIQAPLHTVHHPRDNPRPSSTPPDDASMLTLASSAFGVPGARIGAGGALTSSVGASTSVLDIGDGASALESAATDSTSQFGFTLGEDGDGEREVAASMRALRSRRSWESQASRWSARVGGPGSLGPATPLVDKTLWAGHAGSARTGGQFSAAEEAEDRRIERPLAARPLRSLTFESDRAAHLVSPAHERASSPLALAPKTHHGSEESEESPASANSDSRTPLPDNTVPSEYFPSTETSNSRPYAYRLNSDDSRSLLTDNQTDLFVSAPSTPMTAN